MPKVKAVKPTMEAIKAKAKKAVTFAEAEAAVGPAPEMADENQPY